MILQELKRLIDQRGITPYQFWKQTNLNQRTAYRLYNNRDYIPREDVMDKLGQIYGWQPGAYIIYLPDAPLGKPEN